jgi:hypothetical protein
MDQLMRSPLIAQWSRSLSRSFHVDLVNVVTADSFGRRIGCV